jgi:hypothetical protein
MHVRPTPHEHPMEMGMEFWGSGDKEERSFMSE